MKILLIYPYSLEYRAVEDDIEALPIGMYYVASLLIENGFQVELLNWYNVQGAKQQIARALKEKQPDIIGFSILNANRWGGIEIAKIAKKVLPNVKIIFGGVSPTFLWKHFLSHFKQIDYIVLGEGEYTVLEIARAIQQNNPERLARVKGLAFRDGKSIVCTGLPDLVKDLDSLPIPSKYFKYQHVCSSRGCIGRCTFCGSPRFWKRRIRFHSPQNFVTELELLYRRGVNFFFVSDDTFTVNRRRLIEICKEILRRKLRINWFAISRCDCIDEEIVKWMRRAGCIQISFGVEHGSEKIRDLLNKNIKTSDIKKSFYLTQKYGIMARAYFIYGCPGENSETIQDTINIIQEIKPLSALFYVLEIFPGTKLYDDYCKRCNADDNVWMKKIEGVPYFETDPKLNEKMVFKFGQKLKQSFYKGLPMFAQGLKLANDPEFYPLHADFLSRLGMTFTHGYYAKIDAIPDKEQTAEFLFRQALSYHPDHRAFLGLGILLQKKARHEDTIELLKKARDIYPQSEQIATCLGISLLNLGRVKEAEATMLPFANSPQVQQYLNACRQAARNM